MVRHCPECKAQMQDDGIYCWCPWSPCGFNGYRVLRTGKIIPADDVIDQRKEAGV